MTQNQVESFVSLESRLATILGHTNDWLRFAEAKNAVLFTANCAAMFGIATIIASSQRAASASVLHVSLTLFGVSAIMCACTFLPALVRPKKPAERVPEAEENLLYFDHISRFAQLDYVHAVGKLYGLSSNAISKPDRLLAEQIVANARISVVKYKMFSWALLVTLVALGLMVADSLFALVT